MKKGKLITTLCTLVLTIACLTFGVYSAVKTTFTASGTITFNAYGVECDVAVKIVGAKGGDKVLYATTNKTNAKRVAVETRDENQGLGAIANYSSDTAFVIDGTGTLNLGALEFDELNTTKTESERKTITMEVYVINYSNYAIEFLADSDGANGDGSVTYSRQLGNDGLEIEKFANNVPQSNLAKTSTFAYKVVFSAQTKTGSAAGNSAFNVSLSIKPSTKQGYTLAKQDSSLTNISENAAGESVWGYYNNTETKKLAVPYFENDSGEQILFGGNMDTDTFIIKSAFPNFKNVAFADAYTALGSMCFCNISDPDAVQAVVGAIDEGAEVTDISKVDNTIETIILPANLQAIPMYFAMASKITSIQIPAKVTAIIDLAFAGCLNLNNIISEAAPTIGQFAFHSVPYIKKSGAVYIGTVLYRYNDANVTIVSVDSKTTAIGPEAFKQCTKLTTVVLPEGIVSIGANAFEGLTMLTKINFPSTLKSIGDSAFAECHLGKIALNEGLEEIGESAFSNGLTKTKGEVDVLVIPSSVTSIGASAFEGNSISDVYVNSKQIAQGITSYYAVGCLAKLGVNMHIIKNADGTSSAGAYLKNTTYYKVEAENYESGYWVYTRVSYDY